jgi:RNA polymerase sigma-70 factor, ECF subfamily
MRKSVESPEKREEPVQPAADSLSLSVLLPQVYDELRNLARRNLQRERAGGSIQATALVHEAYLRLKKDKHRGWQNRTHFFAIAATAMRRILIERARARAASKRGGPQVRVTLDDAMAADFSSYLDVVALDEILTRLAEFDPQQARIVELRFFTGLSLEEVADEIGVSLATAKRDWNMARAWLRRELTQDPRSGCRTLEPNQRTLR